MKRRCKNIIIYQSITIISSAGNMAMAADVPAGVQLAEKQTLVRNSGAE
ncbi:hypothetical protein, partial [Klebsiella pneumoniae]